MFCSFEVVIAGIFGVIFGSFSTFVGYRLFNKEHKICAKRSVCCNCGKEIKFRDLIPIFSFIFLRGKCRFCKKRIPVWHFLAEIFSSVAFIISVSFFGGFNVLSILSFILIWCLITQSIIDYRTMMSSDVLHSIELFVCVILARLLGREWLEIALMPIATILVFLFLTCLMKKILKKDCLGFGDIQLFAILSVLLNVEQMTLFIGLCGFFGIVFYLIFYEFGHHKDEVYKKREKVFPFIPAISIAFFLAFYIMS